MTLVSRLTLFEGKLSAATDQGLIAAANFVANDIKERLSQGYTSGEYATGNIANSVTVSEPYYDDGDRAIEIGTNVEYGKYWELGFHHHGNGQFYRVEIWRPTLEADGPEAIEIFAATVRDLIADDFS